MAKAKNTEQQAAPVEEKAPKVEKVEQNGVVRPKDGTATGRVWGIADEISATLGKPAPRKDVLAQFVSEGGNEATGATQYGRWRRFHGLTGTGREEEKAADNTAGSQAADSNEGVE